MAAPIASLSAEERITVVATLIDIQRKLDLAGELRAAVYLSHALDVLDADRSIAIGIVGTQH